MCISSPIISLVTTTIILITNTNHTNFLIWFSKFKMIYRVFLLSSILQLLTVATSTLPTHYTELNPSKYIHVRKTTNYVKYSQRITEEPEGNNDDNTRPSVVCERLHRLIIVCRLEMCPISVVVVDGGATMRKRLRRPAIVIVHLLVAHAGTGRRFRYRYDQTGWLSPICFVHSRFLGQKNTYSKKGTRDWGKWDKKGF